MSQPASTKLKGKAAVGLDRDAPWVEKYRPQSLDDVAAHKEIVDTIKRLVSENRLPHLLLYGPPGTGKTSTILAVARQMYPRQSIAGMVLELNASDDRGIGIVRQEIQDFVSTRTVFSNKPKLVILDECDAMTKDAQFALRRVMEKYVKNARFCLICNYVSKIVPAVQSRCTRFRFPPLKAEHVQERLQHVINSENVQITQDGMEALVVLGAGDMRRSLNILQVPALLSQTIHRSPAWMELLKSLTTAPLAATNDEATVYANTGNPTPGDIEKIFHLLWNESFTTSFRGILEMQVLKGLALLDIVTQLLPWVYMLKGVPPEATIDLVEKLADVEYRLAFGTNEKLQLGSLVGAFVQAKHATYGQSE